MALNTADLWLLRAQIGDEDAATFEDSELNIIYLAMSSNLNLTTAKVFEILAGDAAKFADYKANEREEKRKQIFDNLLKQAAYYRQLASAEGNQLMIVGIKRRPPRNKTSPFGENC